MHRRTAHGNRIGITVVGVLLLVGGGALIAANRGAFGSAGPSKALYPADARRFVTDNDNWLWPVVAAVVILLGLLFLRWLLVQARVDRLRRLRIDFAADGGDETSMPGRTTMPATALTDVIADDLDAVRGVRKVSAGLTGSPDSPELWLTVTVAADADLARIRRHLSETTIPDAQLTLELDELPTYVDLVITNRAQPARPLVI